MSGQEIVVVGGGFTGLAAAYDLVRAGWRVTVIEADEELGGLAGTFEILPGVRLEKFYHHWFTSDRAILDLAEELGLGPKIRYLNSRNGLYYANSQFRLSSPLDLLKFTPLPLLDRVRTGVMALAARSINDWRSLEDLSAEEWILKYAGRRSYEVIWKPLLQGKFGDEAKNVSAVWFWNKLKLRGSSRGKGGKEQLIYIEGGFQSLTDTLKNYLVSRGVEFRLKEKALSIDAENGRITGLTTSTKKLRADFVLATIPLPQFLEMTPSLPQEYVQKYSQVRFLGNVCLVLRLKKSLSETYWMNVADPTFPFVGVIEHTNFDKSEHFQGEHIVYLSKYLPTTEKLFNSTPEEVRDFCIPYLQRMFPEFGSSWISGYHVWKANFSQPVITKHYSSLIPSFKAPVEGLWLCTMSQVYPEDRGTNYAVHYGREVAGMILKDQESSKRISK